MSVDLLPCAFCGAPGFISDGDHGTTFVECSADCEMNVRAQKKNAADAAALWNRRAATSPAGDLEPVAYRYRERGFATVWSYSAEQPARDADGMPDWEVEPLYPSQALRYQSTGVTGEWQPIDTAPRTPSEILLWGVMKGRTQPWKYIGSWFPHRDGGWWVAHAMPIQPTHWMPLPSAPAALSAQERG